MQATAAVVALPEVPSISPVDWMSCLPWLKHRRDKIVFALLQEATHLGGEYGLHQSRVDALAIFDRRIEELALERLR